MLVELRNKLNEKYQEEYEKGMLRCEEILLATQNKSDKWEKFFHEIALKYKLAGQLVEDWSSDFYLKYEECELKNLNKIFFKGVSKADYEKSYFNPTFAIQEFGKEMGTLIYIISSMYQPLYHKAVEEQCFELAPMGTLLSELYTSEKEVDTWKSIMRKIFLRRDDEISIYQQMKVFSPEYRSFLDIVEKADLTDLRYLYQYFNYVSENEIETAKFLNNYPQEKIEILAKSLVDAFIRGFELSGKDYSKKKTVTLLYNMGQERIIRAALPLLKDKGLQPIIYHAAGTKMNPQYNYDHRYDNLLLMDEDYINTVKEMISAGVNGIEQNLREFSGNIYFDRFGEELFSPEQKADCYKPDGEQQKLLKEMSIYRSQLYNKFMPREEISFCIIGFPVPEIGKDFAAIFEDTLKINMLDSQKWETIQQHIIDILDKADYVEVKGKGKNRTDIKVKMQKLEKPQKQTNFCNCSADVNIPVGEVFTSPQLTGTNGTLHVTDIYLNDLHYLDLELTFKDGFAVDYTCRNYDDAEKNRKFVFESLFLPHQKLPLGEFAIGTNTLAYLMAKKFDILPQMPILIIEKMGPHFAIGDTCYSWEEDRAVYNPDGKEIMSRDNEVSILRKEDINKAYTNKHTDITLPYEELGVITAVSADGQRYDIIRDGRFVVKGTEELNEPLEDLEKL